jgi:cell division protein FtsI/penicillin-binding protein 2
MISRRCLLAAPFVAWAGNTARPTEYLAHNLLDGDRVSRWDQPDRAVSMGSLLKPFLVVAYARTHNSFPHLVCRGAADRCWLPKGHGPQDVVSALANSCNFYFRQLSADINSAALQSTCSSYGLEPPMGDITPERLIGLGPGWPQRPSQVLMAFAQLSRNAEDRGVVLAIAGMRQSVERGTAKALGWRALGKTGTAPCSHTPRSEGDGYTAILYPLDRVRLVLLVRQCGTTGAHTAQLAGPILQRLL